jgi:hypothetical protein
VFGRRFDYADAHYGQYASVRIGERLTEILRDFEAGAKYFAPARLPLATSRHHRADASYCSDNA